MKHYLDARLLVEHDDHEAATEDLVTSEPFTRVAKAYSGARIFDEEETADPESDGLRILKVRSRKHSQVRNKATKV